MRQLFKGDNYSREETIRGNTVFDCSAFGIFFIFVTYFIFNYWWCNLAQWDMDGK